MDDNLLGILKPSQLLPPLQKHRRTKPSTKQMAAVKYIANGMSQRQAMIKAGYAVSTANIAKKRLIQTKHGRELIEDLKFSLDEQGLNNSKLAEKLSEWLDANKVITSMTEPDREVPDYDTQIKAFDRITKIKGIDTDKNGKIKRQLTVTEFIGVNEGDGEE